LALKELHRRVVLLLMRGLFRPSDHVCGCFK
jgi:hypothetical protein